MTKLLTNQDVDDQKSANVNSDTTDQLSLFPNQRLHSVPKQPVPSKRRPIRLPRSILVILPTEQLHNYLSRVAAAAMNAATKSYGSATLAALRLGTSDSEDPEPTTGARTARPRLTLAASVHQNQEASGSH
jgi:hypothetical protein